VIVIGQLFGLINTWGLGSLGVSQRQRGLPAASPKALTNLTRSCYVRYEEKANVEKAGCQEKKSGEKEEGVLMAAGAKHYFRTGKAYNGPTHKMKDGALHTGATHTASSKPLFHMKDLSATAKKKAKEQ